METERFWVLLARKISTEITASEEQELQQFLSDNPDYHFVLEALQGMQPDDQTILGIRRETFLQEGWERLSPLIRADKSLPRENADADISATEMAALPELKYPRRIHPWKWAAAALVLLVPVLAWKLFFTKPAQKQNVPPPKAVADETRHIHIPNGSRMKIVLPDKSNVSLNGGSDLSYNANLAQEGVRSVCLNGEAYFDIHKDASHPFIIHTAEAIIRVLGTSFNIRAYEKEGKTSATLIEGKIEVSFKHDPNRHIILHPREKLTILNNTPKTMASGNGSPRYKVSTIVSDSANGVLPVEIAWVSNRLVFKNETFEEVAFKMEKWYGVKIVFRQESLKKEILAGAFSKETLDQALSALQLTTAFHYEHRSDTVYLYR